MPSQSPKKILVTGSTGLVGSRFLNLYKDIFSITTVGRKDTDKLINMMSREDIIKVVEESNADKVINFAAFTRVDEAEKEKMDRSGEAYVINVLLPTWLAEACKTTDKTLYHISTDYVFDGKQEDRPYTEEDTPSPVDSWYAITKYEGEKGVTKICGRFSIIRISYPFSGVYRGKADVARTLIDQLQRKEIYSGIIDQKIKPTSVDDIADALSLLINKNAEGIYHIAGNYSPNEYITPYQFAQNIARIMALDLSLIKPISFVKLSKKRLAPRPQHTWLSTKKIESLGFQITNINEALKIFMQQLQGKA